VTLVKPVRVGFTALLTDVANDPAPILCLLPTEADCRDYMVSGALSRGLEHGEDRSTILHRLFRAARSRSSPQRPRNLRRHTARVLLIDEADAMEVTAEGSPVLLAERRTLTFRALDGVSWGTCGNFPREPAGTARLSLARRPWLIKR